MEPRSQDAGALSSKGLFALSSSEKFRTGGFVAAGTQIGTYYGEFEDETNSKNLSSMTTDVCAHKMAHISKLSRGANSIC